MKNVKNRILSLILCVTFVAATVFIPMPFGLKVNAETTGFSGTLGSEWTVGWNGSETPADEFVKIVTEQKYMGGYSLRIGHPQEKTQLTLKLQVPVSSVEAYQYAVWAKVVGVVDSAKLYLRDGENGLGAGNILEYNITDKISDTWTQFRNIDNATEEDTDGSATELTIDSGVFCLDIGVTCPAGSYLYIDNLDIFSSAVSYKPLYADSSFERFILSNKATSSSSSYGHAAYEFIKVVSDDIVSKNTNGENNALRIGHATLDTNITMVVYSPLATDWKTYKNRNNKDMRNYFTSDFYIDLPDGVDTTAEDYALSNYITTSTVEFSGYEYNTKSANARAVVLSNIGEVEKWNSITTSNYVAQNDFKTAKTSGGYVYTSQLGYVWQRVTISCKAGVYIYLDNMNVYTNANSSLNLLADPGFEEKDIVPSPYTLRKEKLPSPWYGSSEAEAAAENYYITPDAYEGKQALAVTTLNNNTNYTLANKVEGLTANQSYTFEAYVKVIGNPGSSRFWRNDHSATHSSNELVGKYFNTLSQNTWTKISSSFTATDGDTHVSLRVTSLPKGCIILIDAVKVYASNDENKINLMEGGGFEAYVPQPVTSLTSSLVVPSNWNVSWNSNQSYRYHYRSNEAHSGNYALALKAKEKKMGHTFKQSLSSKVEVGAEYTLEGYFKKVGSFSAISLMETATGASNVTFKQLKDANMNEYTFVTAKFTARAGSGFNIYTVSTIDSLLLVDDLKIYKSDDETKTNLLVNGGFENWKASNQEQYRVKKTFATAPATIEATVMLPTDFSADENAGVIVGNYNGKDESINLEVTTNGNPRVYIIDADGNPHDLVFDGVDLRTGEWTHIAVVKNTATIDLYVDGVLSGSKDFIVSLNTAANPYAISGDNITVEKRYSFTYEPEKEITNPNYFKGEIKNVAFYDDIRTAEEIANDVTAYGTEGLIAAYNMWNTFDPEVIADGTGNGYYALRYGNFIKEIQAEDDDATAYPYSFVALGDTQYVCERDKKSGTDDMSPIYDWIIDNKESKNIQFVMGLGDITDEATEGEYAIAATQFKKLQDAGIRYSVIKGNHDGIFGYDTESGKDPTRFDEYLADGYIYDGVHEAPVFDEEGNLVSGTAGSTYHKIEVSGQKWLVLALDYNASEEVFAWANNVISSNPDYRVIITTHGYIKGSLEWAYLDKSDYSSGEYIWTNLASLHDNVEMVLCGHHSAIDIAVNKRVGVNGNIVTEMLIDRQTIDQSKAYGHVTLLRFSADGTKIKVEDFAAVQEKYFRPSNQFVLDINPNATENDAALFNFDDYLNRNKLYGNKDAEIQNLVSVLKTNIATAEGNEAVTAAYNTAIAAVIAPEAPTVALEGTTATITATDGYEYSTDGINWQSSPTFTELPINTAVTFYQRKSAETTGGYASLSSTATECMIVSAPTVLVGETSIWVKPTEGYEYSIGNDVWQESNVFNDGIVNGDTYTVYQRPIGSDSMTLLTNGTTITVDGTEPIDNPTVTELARMRNQLLENGYSHDISMDYNDDYIIDARDIVKLKKFLAYLDVA